MAFKDVWPRLHKWVLSGTNLGQKSERVSQSNNWIHSVQLCQYLHVHILVVLSGNFFPNAGEEEIINDNKFSLKYFMVDTGFEEMCLDLSSCHTVFHPDIKVLIGPGEHRIWQPVWNSQLLKCLKIGLQAGEIVTKRYQGMGIDSAFSGKGIMEKSCWHPPADGWKSFKC